MPNRNIRELEFLKARQKYHEPSLWFSFLTPHGLVNQQRCSLPLQMQHARRV